ncbi:hypothetical protein NTCA1_49170 [Novosphingobium sp. TCA1]|nr:hypothetical protein NTCA1_49170 [Novosphingobium sp. TCA1]
MALRIQATPLGRPDLLALQVLPTRVVRPDLRAQVEQDLRGLQGRLGPRVRRVRLVLPVPRNLAVRLAQPAQRAQPAQPDLRVPLARPVPLDPLAPLARPVRPVRPVPQVPPDPRTRAAPPASPARWQA